MGAALLLLLVPVDGVVQGRVGEAWWDYLHFPAFILGVAAHFLTRGRGDIWQSVRMGAWVVPLVELVQYGTGRESALADMMYGWMGCLAGGFLCRLLYHKNRSRWSMIMIPVLFSLSLVYPVAISLDQVRQAGMFPELSRFEGLLERSRWTVTDCSITAEEGWAVTAGEHAEYPGLFLRHVSRDWSRADALCLDLTVSGEAPLGFWVRWDDLPNEPPYRERFQKYFILPPGYHELRIPRIDLEVSSGGRRMELGHVEAFGMFFDRHQEGRTVRLHRLRVETSGSDNKLPVSL